MRNAKQVILDVAKDFEKMTGRKYGLFEEYKLDDAEVAIVCMNSTAGTTKDVVDSLMPSFTGSTRTSISNAIQSYKAIDAWVDTPVMKESAYQNLLNIIKNAGELTKDVPFSKVVDNTIAQKVASKLAA